MAPSEIYYMAIKFCPHQCKICGSDFDEPYIFIRHTHGSDGRYHRKCIPEHIEQFIDKQVLLYAITNEDTFDIKKYR